MPPGVPPAAPATLAVPDYRASAACSRRKSASPSFASTAFTKPSVSVATSAPGGAHTTPSARVASGAGSRNSSAASADSPRPVTSNARRRCPSSLGDAENECSSLVERQNDGRCAKPDRQCHPNHQELAGQEYGNTGDDQHPAEVRGDGIGDEPAGLPFSRNAAERPLRARRTDSAAPDRPGSGTIAARDWGSRSGRRE